MDGQPIDASTAKLLHQLLAEDLAERKRVRRENEIRLQVQLRRQQLQQQQQLDRAGDPTTTLPQTPSRLPDPTTFVPSTNDAVTPTVSRSFSNASRSSHSSGGMSTPPSQLSTPSSECPPRPRKPSSTPRKRRSQDRGYQRGLERTRLWQTMYSDGDRLTDDLLFDDEMTPAQQLKQDRRDILHDTLAFFDKYCAPRTSPLFVFEKKKTPNPDGTFSLRKNESMNLKLWAKLIRVLLRKIMGPAYLNNHKLTQRFRYAARKIVTKRRANHVQHWRLYGTHKKLIYGGGDVSVQRGNSLKKKLKFGKRKRDREVVAAEPEKSCVDVPVRDEPEKSCVDVPLSHSNQESGYNSDTTLDYDACADADDLSLVSSPDDDVPAPPVSNMQTHKTCCVVCKEPLECQSAFPQDHEDWASSVSRPMRCVNCWNQHVQQKLMPDLQDKIAQKALRQKKSKKKKDEGDQPPPKKKRNTKKPCKCGSFDHRMVTSLNCPLNKRNLVLDPNAEPAAKRKRSESAAKPVAKRKRSKSAAKPAAKPVAKRKRSKPAAKPAVKPAAKPAVKPAAKPAAKRKRSKNPAVKPAAKPPAKKSTPPAMFSDSESDSDFFDMVDDGDCVGIGGYFETPADKTAASTTSPASVRVVTPPLPPSTTSPASVRVVTPPLPPPIRQRYPLGDTVKAKWARRQVYLGHVVGYNQGAGLYSVYFLWNGEVKSGLQERDISPYHGDYITRAEMVNREFFADEAEDFPEGIFYVKGIDNNNEYKCIRKTGGDQRHVGQLVNFDIGYAIKAYQTQLQDERERGIGRVLNTRTRRSRTK